VLNHSTNHPVRNSAGPAWKTCSMSAKVSRSKTDEIGPIVSMYRRMKATSHRRGARCQVRSTRSDGIATCAVSYRKLLMRSCRGSIGRKGRNSDANAMLSMLPKFELVAMRMYFMMLPKLRRPLHHAVVQHVQRLLEQDDVGRVAGHVHRGVHRDADVGGAQGRRVVD